jgi:hypothetical protein
VPLRTCLVLAQDDHEYVRLVAEPGGPIGVSCLLILAGSSMALADFRPDDLIDASAAQAAPLSAWLSRMRISLPRSSNHHLS